MTKAISTKRRLVVTFVTRILTHYRVPFHERVRVLLNEQGTDYRVIYGQPDEEEAAKGDLATLSWGTRVHNRAFFGQGKLVWQPIGRAVRDSDLLVLGQENQLLVNYPLQLVPAALRPRLALWGHGRNFQARNPKSRAERWKRFWATRCDWWFAYTDESRRHVQALGFPPERITVFNNAVDTTLMRRQVATSTARERATLAASMGLSGNNVGVFVGGLYPDKRLEFLIAAADRVREHVPDFELLVLGGGAELPLVERLAQTRSWVHVMGPRFGQEKINLMMLGQVFMMPGLMGLAILDAAAAGLVITTTAYPWHSPEIAYLEPGVSGLLVAEWESPETYGREVAELLQDRLRLERMRSGSLAMAKRLSIEAMAQNFASGVAKALAA